MEGFKDDGRLEILSWYGPTKRILIIAMHKSLRD